MRILLEIIVQNAHEMTGKDGMVICTTSMFLCLTPESLLLTTVQHAGLSSLFYASGGQHRVRLWKCRLVFHSVYCVELDEHGEIHFR